MSVPSHVAWLDRRLYPDCDGHWDDEIFRREVLAVLRPTDRLLDLGAGAGIVPEMNFRGACARVCGLDPDARVLVNPHLDDGRVGTGEMIPWPDASFDVVAADNVLEHLDDPERVLREVARVLVPGGRFLAKTPNRRHYVPAIARCTPHAFHAYINKKRGRARADTFPTRYRANTRAAIRRIAHAAGLEVERIDLHEKRPEYLRFNAATYLAGWAWERAVNTLPPLEPLRVLLVARLRRPLHESSR
jgi:SAM-dependent methyltransferase